MHLIRQSLFLLFFSWMQAQAELLPEIEAAVSHIIPTEMSKSGRVYRFKIKDGEPPRTGSIILVQSRGKPIMAFRVLKTEDDDSGFVAKRVRRYDTEGELKLQDEYVSAEKVANLFAPPPIENRFNPDAKPELDPIGGKDLNPPSKDTQFKLDPDAPPLLGDGGPVRGGGEKSVGSGDTRDLNQFDSDLDYGTSPRNLKRRGDEDEDGPEPGDSGDGESESVIEETKVFNPYRHMIGATIGSFRNMSSFSIPGDTHYGFSLWYNRVIQKGISWYSRRLQDSLAIEGGITHYSRVNYTGNNDGYDLLPLKAELVYALHVSEKLAFLGHAGLQYNWIYSTDNVNPTTFPAQRRALDSLAGIQPNLGMGVLYHIGPQWFLRADAGLDRFAIGLAVKW